ncbi:MAG: hypothetical protein JJE09_04930 [Bacteroidia bacterium]|nr:hypothetical protein [Bacteroidia bacterium]
MHNLIRRNYEFWNHERSLKALLIYITIALFVWIPLADYSDEWWSFLISELFFNMIILAGVFSVLTRWRKQLIFISIATLTSLLRIVSFFTHLQWAQMTGYFFAILFLIHLANLVLQHIFKEGPVNFYRIQGSIIVFMVIGIVYAFVYTLLESFHPGSFTITEPSQSYKNLYAQFLYFSFATMTTLGFGDMIPTQSIGKSLVIFQGMIGLLYPVIMIARLVSLELSHSATNKESNK